jgi:hypothetical protein
MKEQKFILIGDQRIRISTIKKYSLKDNKITIWYNTSRYQIQHEVFHLDIMEAQIIVQKLDIILL